MLSRVANSIYWLGRYLERAENYARFIDVNINLSMDLPPDMNEQWEPLVKATGSFENFKARNLNFDRKQVIHFLTFDVENLNSIISSVTFARENARIIRENLTKETWEKLNELYHFVKKKAIKKEWKAEDLREFFESVKNQILLIYGLAESTVARSESWHFRQLGMYLERADMSSRILDVKYHILLPSPNMIGTPLDFLHWTALLKSVTAFNTYRRLYGNIDSSNVVEFLVLNETFPRSIYYCLVEAEKSLYKISTEGRNGGRNTSEKVMGELRSKLEFDDVTDVINTGLHEYLDEVQLKIIKISNEIDKNFFQIKHNFAIQQMEQ